MFSRFLAFRYLFFRRKSQFINLLTFISFCGIWLGTAAMVIILSVFNGLEDLYTELYAKSDPDFKLELLEGKFFKQTQFDSVKLDKIPGLRTWSMTLDENVLMHFNGLEIIGRMKGVDHHYPRLDTVLLQGHGLRKSADVVIGRGVSIRLGLSADSPTAWLELIAPSPEKVNLMNPESAFSRKSFNPVGVFDLHPELNNEYIMIGLDDANELLQRENIAGDVEVWLETGAHKEEARAYLEANWGKSFKIQDRFSQKSSVYAVFRSEKLWSFLILSCVVFLLSLNLIGSMSMLIVHKQKDIKLFYALGASRLQSQKIFAHTAMYVVIGGVIMGLMSGSVLCSLQETYGFIEFGGGGMEASSYPVSLRFSDLIWVSGVTAMIGMVCAWIPIRKIK